jgi:hypothetical protein
MVNLNMTGGGEWDLGFVNPTYFANLLQFPDDFFYAPGTKSAALSALQENCVLLPYYFHAELNVNINDTLSAQVIPSAPYNGTGTQENLKVVGFYYGFSGVEIFGQVGPLVCSNETLESFQGEAFPTDILFSSSEDVSQVASSLNATYGSQGVYVSTYQQALAKDQSDDYLNYAAVQDYTILYAILLFGEFSVAFATILNGSKDFISNQRARGETFGEIGKLLLWSYGVLLAIGIAASLLLDLLGAALANNSQNNFFFRSDYLYDSFWIGYPLVFPWNAIGWVLLLLAAIWGIILTWFVLRIRKVNFNAEFRQVGT